LVAGEGAVHLFVEDGGSGRLDGRRHGDDQRRTSIRGGRGVAEARGGLWWQVALARGRTRSKSRQAGVLDPGAEVLEDGPEKKTRAEGSVVQGLAGS